MFEFLAHPLTIWIILAVIAGIAEVSTAALVSIWFVLGSIIGGVASLCGAPIWLQIVLAIASSFTSFVALRKFVLPSYKAKRAAIALDDFASTIASKRGVVTKTILPGQVGQVRIDADYWQARALDDDVTIPENMQVVVYKVEGATCIVGKLSD